MKKFLHRIPLTILILIAFAALLSACVSSGKPGPENKCQAPAAETIKCPGQIEWQLCDTAEITEFSCELGEFKNKPALIYKVTIKNTSSSDQRYRLNIFLLDQDKGAGHLVPRKGKPPVIKPGESETVTVPFINTDKTSNDMLVVLKTLAN